MNSLRASCLNAEREYTGPVEHLFPDWFGGHKNDEEQGLQLWFC